MMANRRFLVRATLALSLLGGLAGHALAVDGVIEINHERALAGGITPGDAPGYPVTITEPGSYRLTGNLDVTFDRAGITIQASDVTLDLNGFVVFSPGGSFDDGIQASSSNIEVRNGSVEGFSRHGVFTNTNASVRLIGVRVRGSGATGFDIQGSDNLIQECQANDNGGQGFRTGGRSLVIDSLAKGNESVALVCFGSVGYRSNVFAGNNQGNENAQTAGCIEIGSNICGLDTTCP